MIKEIILLTGVIGFVGAIIFKRIGENGQVHIRAIIRRSGCYPS